MTLYTDEIIRLQKLGIIVRLQCQGVAVCYQGGVEVRHTISHLKRLANPTMGERIRNWLIGRVA